jgi:hypothetical protein
MEMPTMSEMLTRRASRAAPPLPVVRLTIEMVEAGRAKLRVPAVRLPSGELVIHRTPVLEACRRLIAAGTDPKTRFEAWWEGKPYPALLGTVGGAAKLDVLDAPSESPRFVRYDPGRVANIRRAGERKPENRGSGDVPATPLAAGEWRR